ncbi:MAG TPA: HU family DNA-binding protein [Acidimicrobiales bacterium]|nr:HU family DNA-binding protein [Acidimicrobiales bacterium]
MNKSDVIDRVAGVAGVGRQQAENVLDAFFDTVRSATKGGDRVAWPGFGSFTTTQRKARTGRNPRTGEAVKIPATKAVKFSPSSALKDYLNTGGSKRAAGGANKAGAKKAGAKKAAPAAATKAPKKAGGAKSAKKATKAKSR